VLREHQHILIDKKEKNAQSISQIHVVVVSSTNDYTMGTLTTTGYASNPRSCERSEAIINQLKGNLRMDGICAAACSSLPPGSYLNSWNRTIGFSKEVIQTWIYECMKCETYGSYLRFPLSRPIGPVFSVLLTPLKYATGTGESLMISFL
jgi:hypothetical protein